MRIRISFATKTDATFIPINTNFYIAKLIEYLCHSYQKYLNALAPGDSPAHKFDFFTFSQLIIPSRKIENDTIQIVSKEFYLYISSPFYQFLSILSKELLDRKVVKLFKQWFDVVDVNFYSSPRFNNAEAQFTCMSPVTVYKDEHHEDDENYYFQYMFPDEEDYCTCLEKDLLHKYNLLNDIKRKNIDFQLEFDEEYIKRKNNKITKVIIMGKRNFAPNRVRCVLAPLKIKADPEILKLIYESGLGRLNNMGFGMVESVRSVRMA